MTCNRDDRDVRGLLVCIRGTVGCGLEHDQSSDVAVAHGVDACVSTAGRPSEDFDGCTS